MHLFKTEVLITIVYENTEIKFPVCMNANKLNIWSACNETWEPMKLNRADFNWEQGSNAHSLYLRPEECEEKHPFVTNEGNYVCFCW